MVSVSEMNYFWTLKSSVSSSGVQQKTFKAQNYTHDLTLLNCFCLWMSQLGSTRCVVVYKKILIL